LEGLGKPGVFVFGNGDEEWYDIFFIKRLKAKKRNLNFLKKIKNVKDINYGIKKYKGINFFGFGGYMDVSANDGSRDKEWQMAVDKRMKKAEKRFNLFLKKVNGKSIFVFHYPPRGIFDLIKDKKNPFHGKSSGIDFYHRAILKKKPILVLCGHMEEYQGKKKLGSSTIVNPGEGSHGKFAIVEIDDKNGEVKKVEFFGKK
jgi:Icc-related predicted phosphoesterase